LRNIVGLPPAIARAAIEANPVSVNTQNIADSESIAAFGHVVFDLTESLTLNAGVRYSEDTKDVAFDNTFVVAPINIDDDHLDWRLGLDFKVSENLLTYASVATGYRPPAYNPRPFTPAQAVAVGGEEATAFELGFKSDLLDRRVRLNVAAFYTDYKERIVPIGGTECLGAPAQPTDPGAIQDSNGNICFAVTSLTSYQQLEDGEVAGAELEVEWRPTDEMLISGVFGYTDWKSPEIDDCDFNLDGVPDPGLTCADRPPFVPEFNWSFGASYDFAMVNGSSVTPRIDVYGQSEICSSAISALSCSDSYTLLNARLEWTSPDAKWTVAAGGTNITDEEYYLNIFDLTLFGQNTVEAQPGRPAEWYLSFSRNF
jgi:iron complex outermembrane receptor protein